ncbi:hypothetical protein SAMD00019534_107490 [Acytostelium subglobosum LB1]|uniref:hypothetical protein n=1 Tax=Acytostelium subglobosum LB1 TaxID=1410327 RepID=UPI000644D895|nr:hypothetical protein SAMD00019534_107490 [Acytostelium subglobosum LB1]GAM27573.1 hypothetical protein SAMD00019534_107490 [Acytostelium subglobosum LB1]|eukprot:XP_012749638.1 hypothetical protein SAMD00019534_107490 [Acytostelium subglobosum LB1]
MESIFSSLLASSLLVGLPSIIILSVFIFFYVGILMRKVNSKEPLPPIIANYILQCLFSITSYWDNIVSQAKIYRISHDFIVFQCLTVVFLLKVIESLRSGAKTLEQLATITKSSERSLQILLNKLSKEGHILYNQDDNNYRINAPPVSPEGGSGGGSGAAANSIVPNYNLMDVYNDRMDNTYGLFQHPSIAKAWGSTKDCLEQCHSSMHANPSNFFNFIDEKDVFLKKIFDAAMKQKAEVIKLQSLISCHFNFSKYSSVCDLGGGFGYLGFQIIKDHPSTNVIVLDMEETLKHAVEMANNDIQKKDLLANNQIEFRVGDALQSRTIPLCQVYILSEILGVWNRHDCLKILHSISTVLKKQKANGLNATLIVVDSVVDENGCREEDQQWNNLGISSLVMMSIISIFKRTRNDWEMLFQECGLAIQSIKKLYHPPYLSLIELYVV